MEKKVARPAGSLKISNEVITKIAELAATEITGVAVKGQKLVQPEATVAIAQRFISPIKVSYIKEAAVIDINLVVEQGHKAVNVAEAVQGSVKSAVQSMTGIAVAKVNVKIVGVKIAKEQQ